MQDNWNRIERSFNYSERRGWTVNLRDHRLVLFSNIWMYIADLFSLPLSRFHLAQWLNLLSWSVFVKLYHPGELRKLHHPHAIKLNRFVSRKYSLGVIRNCLTYYPSLLIPSLVVKLGRIY